MSLLHNPIGDMPGPVFLLLYAVVILVTLGFCYSRLRQADPTRWMKAPPVPPELDPCEVAYLRGGPEEVLRVVILSLIQRSYLRPSKSSSDKIEKNPAHPDPRHLSSFEKEVYDYFSSAKTGQQIFTSSSLVPEAVSFCRSFDASLQSEQLLLPEEIITRKQSTAWIGSAILLGLGGYKLLMALAKGRHNVGFLIALAAISTMVLYVMSRVLLRRTSTRGRAYLENIKLALDTLKQRVQVAGTSDPNVASPDLMLLLAGVFGIGVLAGTAYDYYPKMLQKAAASPDNGFSTWGSGCGSSSSCSSSGGSCGGGGGCGGGGCGGCGG